jgi:capsular polysaccharide export protein
MEHGHQLADPAALASLGLPQGAGLVIAGVSWWNRRAVEGLLSGLDKRPLVRAVVDLAAVEAAARARRSLVAWASKLAPDVVAACAERGVALVRIEDGFLRSVGLGAGLVSGASYALDRRGIYYDARSPSDLEHLLEHADLDDGDRARGAVLRSRIVAGRLSKYNLAARPPVLPPRDGRERILVPGQVAADAAIRSTLSATVDLAAPNVNLELLRAVRRRHPDALIVYKPHPDVAKGLRPGAVAAE